MSPRPPAKKSKTSAADIPPAKKPAARKLPTTIGDNPLDLLLPAAPVKNVAMTRKQRPAAAAGGTGDEPTTVLSITVPRSLARQVESVLAVSPELSFDQIMSTSLAEVLAAIKGRNRGRVRSGTSVKDLASSVKRRR